jgi:NTE family protein
MGRHANPAINEAPRRDGLLLLVALLAALLAAGCSTTRPWQNLPVQGGEGGHWSLRTVERPIILAVTLSGGGARAAAFGLGVLQELKNTQFTLNGEPTTMLDQLTLISGVSGGSVLAAHYATFGDESLTRFESEFLLNDFEGSLIQLAVSPLRLYRLSSPWYGRSNVLAERLDALYGGRTFGDLLGRPRGPDLLITATDLTTGAPFEFTPEQFALMCSDLAGVPLSFAVAASSAVPIVLTPLTLRNYAGKCDAQATAAASDAVDDNYRARLLRAGAATYVNAEERPYVHLVDGGLADNLGVRAILDRLISNRSISASFRGAPPGSIRKLVLIAVNSERDLGERIDHSDRVPTTRQVVETLLFGAGARMTTATLEMMRDDMQRWRREVAEQRGTLGSPFAADAELHVVSVGLHDVDDIAVRRSVLTIPTAFTIAPEQVRLLVEAGREALRRSPEFQHLRRRLAFAP